MAWIDVTVGLHAGIVAWPGDPAFRMDRPCRMADGAECNVSRIELGVHTGTHMDAPDHFIDGAATIDHMPLKATMGVARVIEIEDPASIKPDALAPHSVQSGERILFKTLNSRRDWAHEPFDKEFVHINAAAAQHLVDAGVRTVGIDYLSVGAYEGDGVQTHKILLGAGVWVIEGLDLAKVEPGLVELICLPMKLLGAEGAPCRALVRPIELDRRDGEI
ncbi:MAG: cyclase family protein [Myxococcota bacterium]